jgi:hypothetical protein
LNIEDAPFSKFIIKNIHSVVPLLDLYLKYIRFLNYAFVCGVIGVAVNYIVYHIAATFIWEPVAFYGAVIIAALSNYSLTVGMFGHWFGLEKEKEEAG